MRRGSHPTTRRVWLVAASLIAGLLAACGSNAAPGLPPSTLVTLPPVPVGTLVAGCSATGLEAWYEVASTLSASFTAEALAALDQPPDALLNTLIHQNDLLDRIVREPVPECAVAAQAALVARLRAMQAAFTAYDEGRIDAAELRTRVTAEQQAIEREVTPLMDRLAGGLDELYRLATQASPGG